MHLVWHLPYHSCCWISSAMSHSVIFCILVQILAIRARISFSVDSDLHEKLLRRIGSRWCKNHVELDLCFCFRSIFFCFPFRMNLLSVQKHWVQYYMVRQSYKIGSMLYVKLDLNVLIQFYISRFDYRWIGSDLQRSGAAWLGQKVSSGFALAACAARLQRVWRSDSKPLKLDLQKSDITWQLEWNLVRLLPILYS